MDRFHFCVILTGVINSSKNEDNLKKIPKRISSQYSPEDMLKPRFSFTLL